MKGGHAWDNNNSVPVADRQGGHGNRWKISSCDFHAVMDSRHGQSPSNICLICPEADLNSNSCMENHSQPNSNCHQMTNNEPISKSYTGKLSPLLQGREYKWDQQLTGQCPTSIYSVSLNQKDLNYDDLSKNIDANLAEIDMETFRSEDIHSILALPVMYSGDFQSDTHGEQCASVSGSLLGGLELDSSVRSSVSPRSASEDEISICKDEPLFSPVKEQPLPDGTISVDSLDCSSLEEHDLVLTCRANKSNYTIAFEGSGTQFSDDSDYQEALGLAETAVWQETDGRQRTVPNKAHTGPMVQSDFAFTTWSKLKRTKEVTKVRGRNQSSTTTKSQSLPNLLRHSVLSDKLLNKWASGLGNKGCVPLYDIQSSQSAHSRDSNSTDSQQSVSLLKLFIRHRMTSSPECGSTSLSSSHSESSAANIMNGARDKTASLTDSYGQVISTASDETSQEAEDKGELSYENYNQTEVSCSPLHSTSENTVNETNLQTIETNNNTINPLPSTDNYNVTHPSVKSHVKDFLVAESYAESEEENSQYFEDSLMDVPPPVSKDFFTSPIKEEEEPLETDTSSGDETMKDSKDPFGSDTGSSQESNINRNNKLDSAAQKQDTWAHGVERINNVFPTGKSNMHVANNACTFNTEEKIPMKRLDFGFQNHSQGTQTKQLNSKDCSPIEGNNTRVTSNTEPNNHCSGKLDILNNIRYSPSRDSSPSSSGYLSSRQGSVERLRHSSQGFINNTNILPNLPNLLPSRKVSVIITKPCHRSTQIPVHIRDQGIQTSLLDENGVALSFCIKETNEDNTMESSYLLKLPMKSKDGSKRSVTSSDESGSLGKRSIYVCYPNYSLPDLSFLRSFATSPEAPDIVYLTPTKHKVPSSSANPQQTQEKKRPKSCSDFDSLSCQFFGHIKDWESLSVLLPDDLKSVISKLQDRGNVRPLGDNVITTNTKAEQTTDGRKSRSGSPVCACSDSNKIKLEPSLSDRSIPSSPSPLIKNDDRKPVRSILRKASSTNDDQDYTLPHCSSMSTFIPKNQDVKFKRYSLQEPCQKVLENIPEINSLMNYIAKQNCLKKEEPVQKTGYEGIQEMKAQPCNSALGAGFKKGVLSGAKKEYNHHQVARTVSDEYHKRLSSPHQEICSNGSSVNSSPVHHFNTPPSYADEGDKKRPSSCSLLSEIPSVEHLQNQLGHLLGSGSNLGLVAAALLAVQDGKTAESNHNSKDENTISCLCSKGRKSVKFGAMTAEQEVTSLESSPCKMIRRNSEDIKTTKMKGKSNSEKINQQHTPEDDPDDMDFPPQEFAVSPSQCSPATTPSSTQSVESVPVDITLSPAMLNEELNKRSGLVENLKKAVDMLVAHFLVAKQAKKQIELGSSALSSSLGPKLINSFCPAMNAVLADGQLSSIPGLLTPVTNSTWRVAEATTKTGNCKRELQELVNHINAEEILCTSIQKFNAFLLGVLNLGCLDWWVGHLCSCENVIKYHYHPTAMLSLLTHQAVTHLKEEFQNIVKPLSSLPFSLELSLVSKDFKSKVSQLSTKKQEYHANSLPSSPVKRNYQVNLKDISTKIPERKCNIIDKQMKYDSTQDKNSDFSIDEFLRTRHEKQVGTVKPPSEENYILSLFPGVTVYPFTELKVSSELEFANKEQTETNTNIKLLNGTEKTAEINSLENGLVDLDNESELLYSSTDSGCSSQIDHISPHPSGTQTADNSNKKEQEGQMFQKLRQKWEQMTSTPEPVERGASLKAPSSQASSRPPLPSRGRTSESRRIHGKSASPAQSRITRPSSNKRGGDVGHHSRRSSPQPSSHRKLSSPAHSQPQNNVASTSDVVHSDSPDASLLPHSSIPKSKPSLPPSTARKSLIPVHRIGSRGGTNSSRSRGTTPVGRDQKSEFGQ